MLGAARRHLGEMAEARSAYEEALALDRNYAEAHCNLGEWCLARGLAQQSLTHFDRALECKPGLTEAINNRVAALYELGRFDEAESAARSAIAAHPDLAALHVNLGNVLLYSGKAREAAKAFQRALEIAPNSPEALLNLSTVLGETRHLGETLDLIRREIAAKGETAQRLVALALAQQATGDLAAAEGTVRRVLELMPGNTAAWVILAGCRSARGDHRGAIEAHQQALEQNPNMPGIFSNVAFDATYLPESSAETVFGYHREWARRFEAPLAEQQFRHQPCDDPARRLRLGYVSGDFGMHPVGFLIRDVLRHHDKEAFEVHCFSMMRKDDDVTAEIRQHADHWSEILFEPDDEVARRIHDAGIDILIDLSGHTAYHRLVAFSFKPAPIQATWIGYFHSTGLNSIDYFITDPFTSPKGCGQMFSEVPVYLPHSRFCYSPPAYAMEPAPPPCLERGYPTFGCFNRQEKLVDEVLSAWARMLTALPQARLLLKSANLDNETVAAELHRRFEALGVAPERVELRGRSSHAEMFAEYADIDIALDPFPFNGGMTTLEALWMGVPVVTIAGQGVVSRQTVSALSNIGLQELAFPDVDAYVQGAIALAGDPARLSSLRQQIRPRLAASPVCQPKQFVRDLEILYRDMWQAYCRGEKLPGALQGR